MARTNTRPTVAYRAASPYSDAGGGGGGGGGGHGGGSSSPSEASDADDETFELRRRSSSSHNINNNNNNNSGNNNNDSSFNNGYSSTKRSQSREADPRNVAKRLRQEAASTQPREKSGRFATRRRQAPQRFISGGGGRSAGAAVGDELLALHQKLEFDRANLTPEDISELPEPPTFEPTLEEFRDPFAYIEKIRGFAENFGIVKVVPPQGWKPPKRELGPELLAKKMATYRQAIHHLQYGDDYDDGKQYTFDEYREMANASFKAFSDANFRDIATGEPRAPSLQELESCYWRIATTSNMSYFADYASDLPTSEFWSGFGEPDENYMTGEGFDREALPRFADPNYYRQCGWNLNNLPFWPASVLRFFRTHINGVTVPWLYMGMLYATFCWHSEDNYLYSINYHHFGAPKQWYGVPASHNVQFETILKKYMESQLLPEAEAEPAQLYKITTQMSPLLLHAKKIPVFRVTQRAGEFVVTYPKAYHGGFSYGYNCGEAVNFAVPDWVRFSREASEVYRRVADRSSVFSHDRLIFTLVIHFPEHTPAACRSLLQELRRLRDEEKSLRAAVAEQGLRNKMDKMRLPSFAVDIIDGRSSAYDDKRMCVECQHTCYMSGVACKCTQTRVACLRHWDQICGCPPSNMVVLEWLSEEDIDTVVAAAEQYVQRLDDSETITEADNAKFRQTVISTLSGVREASAPAAAALTNQVGGAPAAIAAPSLQTTRAAAAYQSGVSPSTVQTSSIGGTGTFIGIIHRPMDSASGAGPGTLQAPLRAQVSQPASMAAALTSIAARQPAGCSLTSGTAQVPIPQAAAGIPVVAVPGYYNLGSAQAAPALPLHHHTAYAAGTSRASLIEVDAEGPDLDADITLEIID